MTDRSRNRAPGWHLGRVVAAMAGLLAFAGLNLTDPGVLTAALPTFADITGLAGAAILGLGGHGVAFADADADGLPDLYVTRNYNVQLASDLLFLSRGGSFVEAAGPRGISDLDYGSHGAVWADLDNDGDFDLVNGTTYDAAGNGAPNDVYRNDGGGFFAEVTPGAMRQRSEPTRAVLAFDVEGDGDLDVFAVSGWLGSGDPAGERNEVYLNDGGFRFTPVTSGALFTAPAGQGATDTDFDGDGDVDVIAANRDGDLNILRNDGRGGFGQEPPGAWGIVHRAYSGITSGDVDGDGDLDLLLIGLDPGNPSETIGYLYRNDGFRFTHVRTFTGIDGYTGAFGDLDLDGDLDLVFAGQGFVHLNDGSGGFSAGPAVPIGGISDPRGIALADIDGDGDLDVAVAAKGSANRLVRNDLASGNWLKLKLVTAAGQAGAFGAVVRLFPAGQAGGPLVGLREARSNAGYLSQDDPILHFGLGSRGSVDVVVRFLDGTTETVSNVAANQVLTVRAGATGPPVTPPPIAPPPVTPPVMPPPPACGVELSPRQLAVPAAGGAFSLSVSAPAGCSWMAQTTAGWIAFDHGAGAGPGSPGLVVEVNPGPHARSAIVAVGGMETAISQAAPVTVPGLDVPGVSARRLDFNGDGIHDFFLYDAVSGAWTQELGTATDRFTTASGTWSPGWSIQGADFNADGRSDLFLYNPATGIWFRVMSDPSGRFEYVRGQWSPGWRFWILDLDADGRSDVFLYDPASGGWFGCFTIGPGEFIYVPGVWSPGWEVYPAALNLDPFTDLFLYNRATGEWVEAHNDGAAAFQYASGRWDAGWNVQEGRFGNDSRTDFFLYNPTTGDWVVVVAAGAGFEYHGGRWAPGWTIRAGDLDGNGADDLFGYSSASGEWMEAFWDGAGFALSAGQWSGGWSVHLVDLDGDGRWDVVLYNETQGSWYEAFNEGPGRFRYLHDTWSPGRTLVSGRSLW